MSAPVHDTAYWNTHLLRTQRLIEIFVDDVRRSDVHKTVNKPLAKSDPTGYWAAEADWARRRVTLSDQAKEYKGYLSSALNDSSGFVTNQQIAWARHLGKDIDDAKVDESKAATS